MKLKMLNGMLRAKNVESRRIDWNGSSKSKLQLKVKAALKSRWGKHIVYEEFPVFGTRLTIDFYNATKNIAIEVQGSHHTGYVKNYFHKGKQDYLHQNHKDMEKRRFCDINNIKLIEVFESERGDIDEEFLDELGAFDN